MKVIIDLCVVPLGVGLSVSKYVAACHEIISDAGLKSELHAYGTNIEGEWDAVFDVVKKFGVARELRDLCSEGRLLRIPDCRYPVHRPRGIHY